ncbi:TonB-dependent receptor [Planctomycetes bacterium Poly30]|uniref:TonB-dependent receptor n=1 Tax=Saltatorellus ferox TaxID=2528018 RepID=UPI0011A27806
MSIVFLVSSAKAQAQQTGSIRGNVQDADFEAPLPLGKVEIVETGQFAETGTQGEYLLTGIVPGTYTVVFSKVGYTKEVSVDVAVLPGQLTDLDASLSGDFTDLDPFVVEEAIVLGGASELGLLNLRFEAPALLDTIGRDLMTRGGASDAADGLKLVSGATVAADSTAVVRGLPDRYVSSQVNGVRLPSANEDKRAVELDQYSAVVIESIQVSKTFTPDQQGDASGGAVNIVLKSIPDEPVFSFQGATSYNTQVTNNKAFLGYRDGGVGALGLEGDERGPQPIGENWTGAVGVSQVAPPTDYKFSNAIGGSTEFDSGFKVGGFLSMFYEKDSSFAQNARDDSWWERGPGVGLTPEITGSDGGTEPDSWDLTTSLFDIQRATRSVQWGGVAAAGVEWDDNSVGLRFLYTHTADDQAVLATDTRGKDYYVQQGYGVQYDPNDPAGAGNQTEQLDIAPYLRTESLQYTERTTSTIQLHGDHKLPFGEWSLGEAFQFKRPELQWTMSSSFAQLDQPDKRLFGAKWFPGSYNPATGVVQDPFFEEFKPDTNFILGNLQRIYKKLDEDSLQGAVNLTLPFEQWDSLDGAFKFGVFEDRVDRTFDINSFSNFTPPTGGVGTFPGEFGDSWAANWENENHPISDGAAESLELDVDYTGNIDISAWYGMIDLPVTEAVRLVTGVRVESTDIGVTLDPEAQATWFPQGQFNQSELQPGEGDVSISQSDTLPSIGLSTDLTDAIEMRLGFSKTLARQTFKELTPVLQQEFLGGPIFIGNPELELSNLDNYDLRFDYRPDDGTLLSASYFYKDIDGPIEYIQREIDFNFTFPINYPKGKLSGFEFEARQSLERYWEALEGLSFGANATFIQSEVSLPDSEAADFASYGYDLTKRDATNAPEHLFNVYLTYDVPYTGTLLGLFYTVRGDTLVTGDSLADNGTKYIPAVYQEQFDTLNFSVAQQLSKHFRLQFRAKNLTNPSINEIYRSDFVEGETLNTTFTRGIEYSVSISANFQF